MMLGKSWPTDMRPVCGKFYNQRDVQNNHDQAFKPASNWINSSANNKWSNKQTSNSNAINYIQKCLDECWLSESKALIRNCAWPFEPWRRRGTARRFICPLGPRRRWFVHRSEWPGMERLHIQGPMPEEINTTRKSWTIIWNRCAYNRWFLYVPYWRSKKLEWASIRMHIKWLATQASQILKRTEWQLTSKP